jgi:hypothetical protein
LKENTENMNYLNFGNHAVKLAVGFAKTDLTCYRQRYRQIDSLTGAPKPVGEGGFRHGRNDRDLYTHLFAALNRKEIDIAQWLLARDDSEK